MYDMHPSGELRRLFERKPYQGADPLTASVLFIGLDANFGADIDSTDVFPRVVEYLSDGVAFWRTSGVHHPFLLPEYRGDGRFYHRSFARLGFSAALAHRISFVELIEVPTVGTNKLSVHDLNRTHLSRLQRWIESEATKMVFVPSAVGALMFESRAFPWMKRKRPRIDNRLNHLKLWGHVGPAPVYWHYHFSVYGKFEAEKKKQLAEMASIVTAVTSELPHGGDFNLGQEGV